MLRNAFYNAWNCLERWFELCSRCFDLELPIWFSEVWYEIRKESFFSFLFWKNFSIFQRNLRGFSLHFFIFLNIFGISSESSHVSVWNATLNKMREMDYNIKVEKKRESISVFWHAITSASSPPKYAVILAADIFSALLKRDKKSTIITLEIERETKAKHVWLINHHNDGSNFERICLLSSFLDLCTGDAS